MRIVWNEQSIRWFEDASRFTGYHEKLAKILLENIPVRGMLCDMGCGSGLADLVLAPHFTAITCVDRDATAISALQKSVQALGISNINTLLADGKTVRGQWDTVMALFHGGEDACRYYLPLAKDRLVLVTHGSRKGSFGPGDKKQNKCFDAESLRMWLDREGYCYRMELAALEYGQPFRDREDACNFLRAYAAPMDDAELQKHLDQVLVKTEDREFPLYLPNHKRFGIFVIRRDENAHLL